MKKILAAAGLAALLVFFLAAPGWAQGTASKVLEGKVYGGSSQPLTGAIVYLQSSKDNSIRTFITTADGSYRFGQISSDIDYTVWAQYKGEKSGTKNISSFDSKKALNYDFHIKADK
ncbi:carboxypeptidase-like regulatory domain-containing protein [Silvibacterium sp.]|uniref:carboxypeptidase-like regulatory domain-containing protein n=1 Tax=Silvibacterium sp. TaxID=1964179 RepID=UPI0039E240F1